MWVGKCIDFFVGATVDFMSSRVHTVKQKHCRLNCVKI